MLFVTYDVSWYGTTVLSEYSNNHALALKHIPLKEPYMPV
jgi:hypothetical protein